MKANRLRIRLKRLPGSEDLQLPSAASEGSSGVDLLACVEDDVEIDAGESKLIPTGLSVEIPGGYEAQVRPRSGLALHHGITILNSPGTIDSDYRGEIGVILTNHGKHVFTVSRGDRIAQLVICAVWQPEFDEVEGLEESGRGPGGFGHTGI
jgi:dUTP pyrophosphatase